MTMVVDGSDRLLYASKGSQLPLLAVRNGRDCVGSERATIWDLRVGVSEVGLVLVSKTGKPPQNGDMRMGSKEVCSGATFYLN
ncbi:hypothetical protein FHW96_004861 [Novosphingobium sp. SG751A]|nr:hypothetical protein [Novosphingobium sp. SG751A]